MATLRVACTGTGYFSQFHYEAWKRMPGVDLVAVANRSPDKARAFAATYDIPSTFDSVADMLDGAKPDVLDIITPPETHLAAIRDAASRSVFVICQKPFCRTLEEAEEAVGIGEAGGIGIAVHENFRFQPWHRELKRLLDEGRIGDPYQMTFRMRPGDGQGPDAYLGRQPYFQKMPRFLVHETAIHMIDVFRFLMGDITGVYADLRRLNPVIAGEDAGIAVFDFANGVKGLFDGNRLSDHKAENRRLTMGELWIEGSHGVLTLDGDGAIFWRPHGSNVDEPVPYTWQKIGFAGDCVFETQRHIVAHIVDGTPLMNSARDYLTNIRIENAVYQSAQDRRHFAV
jgi:predicted dehydrogenase